MLIAHRGESQDAPENTLAAINLAWTRNADAVEIDVQLSADERVVVAHDRNMKRLTGRPLLVRQSTLAQLKALDVGRHKGPQWTGQRIPELPEVLQTVPRGKRLLIEIKSGPDVLPRLASDLAASPLTKDQILIIGFDLQTMTAARRALDGHPMALLCRTRWKPRALRWGRALPRFLARARRSGMNALDVEVRPGIDAPFVRTVKDAGFDLYVYTVNDPDTAARLLDAGVDGVTSDCAHRLSSALRDR